MKWIPKIVLSCSFLLVPSFAYATIANVSFGTTAVACSGTSCTYSSYAAGTTGTNGILVANVLEDSGFTTNSCTFNTNAMTKAGEDNTITNQHVSTWYITGANSAGTHDIICTMSNSGDDMVFNVESFSGVSSVAEWKGQGHISSTASNITFANAEGNDWASLGGRGSNSAGALSGTPLTVRAQGEGGADSVADSGQAMSGSTQYTYSGDATRNIVWGVSLVDVTPPATVAVGPGMVLFGDW